PARGNRRAAASGLKQRRPQLGQLRLQLRGHLFANGLPDEPAQILLEAVAPPAIRAQVQMLLRDRPLLLVEITVEERLQELLTLLAGIHRQAAHAPGTPSAEAPSTACSASSRLRIRRPRCRRDMTVPTGMSRIWAASL